VKLRWVNDRTGHWIGRVGERDLFEIDCFTSGGHRRAALYRLGNGRTLGLLLTGHNITDTKAYASLMLTEILALELHPSITTDRILRAVEGQMFGLENPGFCIACGEDAESCEPDA
jgi:hypothetical protein